MSVTQSATSSDAADALRRQRRFLILMSLAVIAYYALGVGVRDQAEYNGFVLHLAKPEGAVGGLWLIWVWALLRYGQRSYEQRSDLCGVLTTSVEAEDRRIALARARRTAKRLAGRGHFEDIPKGAASTYARRSRLTPLQ